MMQLCMSFLLPNVNQIFKNMMASLLYIMHHGKKPSIQIQIFDDGVRTSLAIRVDGLKLFYKTFDNIFFIRAWLLCQALLVLK